METKLVEAGPARVLGVLLLLAAVAGCGSTVAGSAAQLGGAAGGNLAAGSNNLGTGPAGGSTQAGGGTPSTGGGQALGPAGTGPGGTGPGGAGLNGTGTGPGTGPGSVGTGPAEGRGVTPTAVYIGIGYTKNGDAENAALGAAAVTQGDIKGETEAWIHYINAHGGVAGRKLVAYYHAYDATSTDTAAAQEQAACADYTQDHKLFAVADNGGDETLPRCLTQAGAFQDFSGDLISHDQVYFNTYPAFFDAGTLTQDRMMADEVRALTRRDWFSPWDTINGAPAAAGKAKLGVLSLDSPYWNRPVAKVLLPALARVGYPVDPHDVYAVKSPQSNQDVGNLAADVQAAVLRFRNDGVTHAVMLDASGLLTLLFTKNSGSQHYYPRLGVNSGSGLQALVDAKAMDPSTLKGALGLGWAPTLDLEPAAAARYSTSSQKLCLSVMAKSGYSMTSTNAQGIAESQCDEISLISYAINHAGPSITLGNAVAAVNALGAGFIPAGEPTAFFSPTQHAAASTGFDLMWDSSCTCAKYLDPAGHRIP